MRALKDERLAALENMAARLAHEVNQPLAAAATLLAVARRRLAPDSGERNVFKGVACGGERFAQFDPVLWAKMTRVGPPAARPWTRPPTKCCAPARSSPGCANSRSMAKRTRLSRPARTIHETLAQLEGDSSFAGFDILVAADGGARSRPDRSGADRDRCRQSAAQRRAGGPARGRRAIVVASRNQRDNIEVSVIDYGSGLSEDARRHMFEPFWTTKGSGMGVGLAMSKAIVEAHYGTIWPDDDRRRKRCSLSAFR